MIFQMIHSRFLILTLLLAGVSNCSQAAESSDSPKLYQELLIGARSCMPSEDVGSSAAYMSSLVKALAEVKNINESISKAAKKKNAQEMISTFLESEQKIGCALRHLDPFLNNSIPDIAKSASMVAYGFCAIADLDRKSIQFLKAALNGEADMRAGTEAERSAKAELAYKDAYKTIGDGVTLSTFPMVISDASHSRLSITEAEKKAILQSIGKFFGNSLKKPRNYFESDAAALHKFFKGSWETKN